MTHEIFQWILDRRRVWPSPKAFVRSVERKNRTNVSFNLFDFGEDIDGWDCVACRAHHCHKFLGFRFGRWLIFRAISSDVSADVFPHVFLPTLVCSINFDTPKDALQSEDTARLLHYIGCGIDDVLLHIALLYCADLRFCRLVLAIHDLHWRYYKWFDPFECNQTG